MPLTFAHPAAVLPLFRGPFVPAALVAGSMSPDLPYFLAATGMPVTAQSWYEPFFNATTSHSFIGALTVSLPAALLLYLVLLAAVRPVSTLLPAAARSRNDERAQASIAVRCGWVLVSLVIGIATHLAWDDLTHGWIAANVAVLQEPWMGSVSGARVLQHASTALGLLVIVYFLWRRRARLIPERGTAARRRMLWSIIGAAIAGLAGVTVMAVSRWEPEISLEHALSGAAVGAGLGVTIAVSCAIAAWWMVRLKRLSQATK